MNAGAVILGSVLILTCLGDGAQETTIFDPCNGHENDKKCQTLWKTHEEEVTKRPMGPHTAEDLFRMSPYLNQKWNAFPSFPSNFDGYDFSHRAYDFDPFYEDASGYSPEHPSIAYRVINDLKAQKLSPGPDYVDNTDEGSSTDDEIDSYNSRRKQSPLIQFSLTFK